MKTRGKLLTPIGELHIESVEKTALNKISSDDSLQAGYASKNELFQDLNARSEGDIYRIELGEVRPDPRIQLRESPATEDELTDLLKRLDRLDVLSPDKPWTFQTLEVLKENPGIRAGDLCGLLKQEKEQFKRNVRKLKNLGLTVSLGTGYKLSVRGKELLKSQGNKNSGPAT